jgi:hypothetical protein
MVTAGCASDNSEGFKKSWDDTNLRCGEQKFRLCTKWLTAKPPRLGLLRNIVNECSPARRKQHLGVRRPAPSGSDKFHAKARVRAPDDVT